MTQEALRLAKILENIEGYRVTMTAAHELRRLHEENKKLKEALAEHAMQEVQRLGQEIEQEPEEHRLLRRKWFGHRDTGHLSFTEAVDVTMEKIYAQPEQEPVKWSDYEPDGMHHNKPQKRPQNCGTGYCSCIECVMEPSQRKPLTHDELSDIWFKQSTDWMEFARAIEAAHDIKE